MTDTNREQTPRSAAPTAPSGSGTGPETGTATGSPGTAGTAGTAAEDDRRRIAALPFDRALAELQAVVARLEAGNLPLEESIAFYEQGVLLHEHCSRLLTQAELRVQRLVESAGGSLRAMDMSLGEAEEA